MSTRAASVALADMGLGWDLLTVHPSVRYVASLTTFAMLEVWIIRVFASYTYIYVFVFVCVCVCVCRRVKTWEIFIVYLWVCACMCGLCVYVDRGAKGVRRHTFCT
jgi:hypothetical protein